MAFFGAIFLGTLTLFIIAPRYGIDRFLAIDCGALFAAIGQIFGRFGNIINGDILGKQASSGIVNVPAQTCSHAPCIAYVADTHIQPLWSVIYLNPHSFATPGIAYQPAPVYEILFNLVVLAILWPLRYRLPRIRTGYFFALYLALYSVSQFLVFFLRGTEPTTPFLGIDFLKQAQWTAIAGFLLAVVIFLAASRYSHPWRHDATHPVDWDVPAEDEVPHIPGLSSGAVRRRLGQTAQAKSQLMQVAGPSLGPAPTAMLPGTDAPAWEPTRPQAGSLRNVFPTTGEESRPPSDG
jgi:prolipoprotein diacylglyceryltransferase